MKILWLTNTPCGASEKLCPNLYTGGWLKSLEEELSLNNNIQLSIGFYWSKKLEPFLYKKTFYYPILSSDSGSMFIRLMNRIFLRPRNNKKEIDRLLEVIEVVKPNIIHVHGTELNFGLIRFHTKIPVVFSVQGILSCYAEKYFSGIPFINAFWFEGVKPKLLFRSVLTGFNNMKNGAKIERSVFANANYIIGRTDWDKRITRVLAPKSNYFLNNEILRSQFYENQWCKTQFSDPTEIVTIMSGGIYKGLETIVKTAQILLQNEIMSFKWTVIGQSEESSLAIIVKNWLKVNYNNINIKLVGSKNENEIITILLNSDIYCQVSHIENSPNSVCEAMLLGMPLLASFAGGTDTLLTNRIEGLLVQSGDPYSYAGALLEIANNFEISQTYAQNARKRALIRHNKSTISHELENIYKSIK